MHAVLAASEFVAPPRSLSDCLLDQAQTGLMAFDATARLVTANRAALSLLGARDAAPGIAAAALLQGCSTLSPAARADLLTALSGASQMSTRLQLLDRGALRVNRSTAVDGHVIISLAPEPDAGAGPHRADPLTGLADRQRFHERLQVLLATSDAEIAIFMIDLDRFKAVNDTHGHPTGDALLRLVAQRLRAAVRDADIVSRLGGDEFAVALPGGPDVEAIASRVVQVLSRPYLVERQAAVIGASIGIARAPEHGSDVTGLIRAADLALYDAKASGRGSVRVFDATMDQRARRRNDLALALRRAIPLQQLELHFQPQLTLAARKLVGFEALVRWRHPKLGLIPPDQFIPLAEEMGLILPLGEWVLRTACQQASTWPQDVSVAVNVSPKQLLAPDRLLRAIGAALRKTGLASHRLEIEVTESALVDEATSFQALESIRELGVRISMDDFGTGYSSLSQLRRFPFDKLKIDRSFVRDLGGSDEAVAVVRAIAALGRSLGMSTIAEGVENEAQASIVYQDGCTEMQGYLVSKPVPAADVETLIRSLRTTATD